jgi:hypothetical protein
MMENKAGSPIEQFSVINARFFDFSEDSRLWCGKHSIAFGMEINSKEGQFANH